MQRAMRNRVHSFDPKAAVADALATAGVAVLLALPIIGVRTLDLGQATLGLQYRFGWVAIAAAVAFAGRLLLTFIRSLRRHEAPRGELEDEQGVRRARIAR